MNVDLRKAFENVICSVPNGKITFWQHKDSRPSVFETCHGQNYEVSQKKGVIGSFSHLGGKGKKFDFDIIDILHGIV